MKEQLEKKLKELEETLPKCVQDINTLLQQKAMIEGSIITLREMLSATEDDEPIAPVAP